MRALILSTIALILIAAFSCSNENGGFLARLLKGSGGSAVPVTVESVGIQEKAQIIKIPAILEPSESIDVLLQSDATIEKVLFAEGDMVNAGDILMRISEQDTASRLARLKAEHRDAQTNLEKNTYLLKNRDRLLEEGRIDKLQYDNLESEVQTAESSTEKLRQEVIKLEERSATSTVTSPIAGIVGKLGGSVGLTITAGKPLVTIIKLDPIAAAFRLPSNNASAVRQGMFVRVKVPDIAGESSIGKVTSIGTELDRDNTFLVKAAVPNSTSLYKLGMRAEVEFTSFDKQRTFDIPEEALIKERRAYFVFTVAKGVAHKVQVIPNETIGNRVEIIRGLTEGDLVVVKGHDKLTQGAVVDIWGR